MNPMRAFVTGATGFVGAHLTRHLVGLGYDVHVLCRADADMVRLADVLHAVVPHVADLREPQRVAAAVAEVQPDRVFHLAAATMHAGRSPSADEQVVTNLGGTVALMDVCRELELDVFVNVGDAFEYGPSAGPMAETAPCRPASLDGITKLAATLYGCSLAQSADMPVVTVRPFSIVGCADDPARLVPRLVETARTDAPLAMSDPRVVRDFVSVGDAIDLFVLAADRAVALRGRILNCGSGAPTTLGELVAAVERVTGSAIGAEWGAFPVAAHDLRHPIADIAAARRPGMAAHDLARHDDRAAVDRGHAGSVAGGGIREPEVTARLLRDRRCAERLVVVGSHAASERGRRKRVHDPDVGSHPGRRARIDHLAMDQPEAHEQRLPHAQRYRLAVREHFGVEHLGRVRGIRAGGGANRASSCSPPSSPGTARAAPGASRSPP